MAELDPEQRKTLAELTRLAKCLDHPAIVEWNRLTLMQFVDPRTPRAKRKHRGERGGRKRA